MYKALHPCGPGLELLLSSAASGDAEAFETFYTRTARWVRARVRRIVGDMLADDVVADTYLQVWRTLESFDVLRGDPLAWLSTIARSRALDRLQAERRSHGDLAAAPDDKAIERPCERAGPEQQLAHAQTCMKLHALLDAMGGSERQVITLAHFRDLTQVQIAEQMRIPLGTVKSLTTRGHGKLRAALAA